MLELLGRATEPDETLDGTKVCPGGPLGLEADAWTQERGHQTRGGVRIRRGAGEFLEPVRKLGALLGCQGTRPGWGLKRHLERWDHRRAGISLGAREIG